MNCREAQNHLFADREGAPDPSQRATLEGHVAQCAACQRVRDSLAAALTTWRTENASTPVPDVEREWHAVRRRMRGGVEAGEVVNLRRSRRPLFSWLVAPLGAAAALAVALYVWRAPTSSPLASPFSQVAQADSVDVPGNASTTVFVDDKSGWLIVWASDSPKEI